MYSFSGLLNASDPICCYRKSNRTTNAVNFLEASVFALYSLIMLFISCLFKHSPSAYISATLFVMSVGHMYILSGFLEKEIREPDQNSLDTSTEDDADADDEDEDDAEVSNEKSLLSEFREIIDRTSDKKEIFEKFESAAAVLNAKSFKYQNAVELVESVANEYHKAAREYTLLEQIVSELAKEYREKAAMAKMAAIEADRAQPDYIADSDIDSTLYDEAGADTDSETDAHTSPDVVYADDTLIGAAVDSTVDTEAHADADAEAHADAADELEYKQD